MFLGVSRPSLGVEEIESDSEDEYESAAEGDNDMEDDEGEGEAEDKVPTPPPTLQPSCIKKVPKDLDKYHHDVTILLKLFPALTVSPSPSRPSKFSHGMSTHSLHLLSPKIEQKQ